MENFLPILDKMPSVLAFILIVLGSWAFEGWFFLRRENEIRLSYLGKDKANEKKINELEFKVDKLEKENLGLRAEIMELKLLINKKFA